jgi:hypothetical protein
MSLRASRPARCPDAVVFACDRGHHAIATAMALRMAELEPERRFDIAVCTPDWESVPRSWHDLPVRFVEIDVASVPAFRHPKAWISVGTFYRHVLPGLFEGTYRAILYLDTDTYLRRPGVQGLFDRIDRPFPIAAVLDRQHLKPPRKLRRRRVRAMFDDFGGRQRRFFQAGVLLMQPEQHVAAALGPRILRFAEERPDVLLRHRFGDQGALNAVASDVIVPLSPLWNWTGRPWIRPRVVERFDPYILHFTGPGKPWTLQDDPFIATLNAEYETRLRRLDPGFELAPARDSLLWRESNPRHGFPLFERIALSRRRRRRAWRFGHDEARTMRNLAPMERLIAEAEVG